VPPTIPTEIMFFSLMDKPETLKTTHDNGSKTKEQNFRL